MQLGGAWQDEQDAQMVLGKRVAIGVVQGENSEDAMQPFERHGDSRAQRGEFRSVASAAGRSGNGIHSVPGRCRRLGSDVSGERSEDRTQRGAVRT